jgi:5'(3')-deoxyribonucleotidase
MENAQSNQEYNRTCFVDMDGVIADFEGYFKTLTGLTVDQVTTPELWNRIEAHGKAKFFAELPWTPGGRDLWQYVTQNFLKVKILTALGRGDAQDKQTSQGKMMWLRKNIPSHQSSDIIMVPNKHAKKHYCKPSDIIIDDTKVVIDEWNKKGGIGLLHKTARETIAKLRQYV